MRRGKRWSEEPSRSNRHSAGSRPAVGPVATGSAVAPGTQEGRRGTVTGVSLQKSHKTQGEPSETKLNQIKIAMKRKNLMFY